MVGFSCAIAGTLLFSAKPVLIKLAYDEQATAGTVLALRLAFSLPVYLAVGAIALRRLREPIQRRDIAGAVTVGIAGYYVAAYLDLLGLERISAQLERLILFGYPTLVVIATAMLARAVPGGRTLVALGLTYAGLILLFGHDLRLGGGDIALGAACVFAAAATFAFYVIASRPLIGRLGSLLFTSVAMIAASMAIIVHVGLTDGMAGFVATPRAVGLIFVMAMLATVAPSFLISEAIGRVGSAPSSVVGGVGPVMTSIAAVLMLGEGFTIYHLGGLVLAIAGVVLLTTSPSAK